MTTSTQCSVCEAELPDVTHTAYGTAAAPCPWADPDFTQLYNRANDDRPTVEAILLPVRLVWLDVFPSAPVYIDAYDDGARYWVDEHWRDLMIETLREAMPAEGASSIEALAALPANSRERYDVTDVLGGRDNVSARS